MMWRGNYKWTNTQLVFGLPRGASHLSPFIYWHSASPEARSRLSLEMAVRAAAVSGRLPPLFHHSQVPRFILFVIQINTKRCVLQSSILCFWCPLCLNYWVCWPLWLNESAKRCVLLIGVGIVGSGSNLAVGLMYLHTSDSGFGVEFELVSSKPISTKMRLEYWKFRLNPVWTIDWNLVVLKRFEMGNDYFAFMGWSQLPVVTGLCVGSRKLNFPPKGLRLFARYSQAQDRFSSRLQGITALTLRFHVWFLIIFFFNWL